MTMSWFPLHCHSHDSLLDGIAKAPQIVERLKECGYAGSALTDHATLSGCPEFWDEMTKAKLKPILGCEFYLEDNSHLCALAKSLEGWKALILAAAGNTNTRKPSIPLEKLAELSRGELIVFSGHMASELSNVCFTDPKLAYSARRYEDAKALVRPDWEQVVVSTVRKYQALFGTNNFWVEIQLIDHKNVPATLVVARILRHLAKKHGWRKVATADSHYCRKEDAVDQRVSLCSALDVSMRELPDKIAKSNNMELGAFLRSNNYHIPTLDEMLELHGEFPEELQGSLDIAAMCQDYKISSAPKLPSLGDDPDSILWEKCLGGFTKKIVKDKDIYRARLESEIEVVKTTKLSSYFLIVEDYIRYATDTLKVKVGKGRGSGAGSLISYLIGITRADPIRFGLMFERFYNVGRNTPGNIALPDIDSDFPVRARDKVIAYCRDKYGADRVSQIATFNRMQGRGALKDVFRAHSRCSFEEMNAITKFIPDEAAISDDLQEMRDEQGASSIIMWALQNNASQLQPWATLKEDGEIDGPLGLDFAQAVRLEGTKRNTSRHASALIICSEPIVDIAPMAYDKPSDEMIVSVDHKQAEKMGLVKFDILGLRTLDCIMDAEAIIRKVKYV